MRLEDIKDPKVRRRVEDALRAVDGLKRDLRKEIPDDTKTDSELQGAKPQQALCHEPLAEGEGKEESSQRTIVCIKSFRSRLLDPDNLCAKSLLDGLRYASLIPDDRPQDITLTVSQEKCAKEDERTTIEIVYP